MRQSWFVASILNGRALSVHVESSVALLWMALAVAAMPMHVCLRGLASLRRCGNAGVQEVTLTSVGERKRIHGYSETDRK